MSILICNILLKWAVENVPAIKAPDEQSVCGLTLLSVPAGSLPSPIKAGKSVVTADVLPGLSNTFKLICWFVSSLLGTDCTRTLRTLRPPRRFVWLCIAARLSRAPVIWRKKSRAWTVLSVCECVCVRKIFKMMHTTCRLHLTYKLFYMQHFKGCVLTQSFMRKTELLKVLTSSKLLQLHWKLF